MPVKTDTREISAPQTKFMLSLVEERDYLDHLDGQVFETVHDFLGNQGSPNPKFISITEARLAIDALLHCPKKVAQPKTKVVGADTKVGGSFAAHDLDQLTQLLATLPNTKFGLERGVGTGVFDFFEVTERKSGRRFVNRLLGAPGGWNRKFLPATEQLIVARRFAERRDEALVAYVTQHGRCCRCDAKLSDGKSIADKVGPVCRTKLGW